MAARRMGMLNGAGQDAPGENLLDGKRSLQRVAIQTG